MKKYLILLLLALVSVPAVFAGGTTTRKERKLILEGNALYKERKYDSALQKYTAALKENGGSAEASYNLGLTYLQLAAAKNIDEKKREQYMTAGVERMNAATKFAASKPMLASRANYNLGNIAFNNQDYRTALDLYKQALRLNPEDNDARRNLRITQLKMQNQNNDKNNNNNKDKDKDKDKDKNKDQNKNQDKDKNKDKNKDQNNNQNNQNDKNKQQNQPQNERMSKDAAKQILQAMENKENMTRSRLNNQGKKQQEGANRPNRKNW